MCIYIYIYFLVQLDVWSAGVMLYQMLFGKRPFGHDQTQERILREDTIINARKVEFPSRPSVSNEAKVRLFYLFLLITRKLFCLHVFTSRSTKISLSMSCFKIHKFILLVKIFFLWALSGTHSSMFNIQPSWKTRCSNYCSGSLPLIFQEITDRRYRIGRNIYIYIYIEILV